MVGTKMLSVTEWVLNRGVQPSQVLKLILCLFPNILLFASPAACLMAVLIAFLRLSGDNEITALKASGVSLYQLLPSVLVLAFIGCLIAAFIALIGVPWGNRSFKDQLFKIVENGVDVNIKQGIFTEIFKGVVFYVNSIDTKDGIMKDVFVVDRRDPSMANTIVAQEGRIIKLPESRMITVHFSDGTIFMVGKELESARTLKFNTYDLNVSLDDLLTSFALREKAPKEMFTTELITEMKGSQKSDSEYNALVIELLERFSIPVAVFFIGLAGAPLGAQIRSSARSFGIFASLVIFLAYYTFFLGMKSLSETEVISPYVGMWIPDIFLILCSIYLIRRVARERPIRVLRRFSFG
jgi:lipopolysaccharide export system permease protein